MTDPKPDIQHTIVSLVAKCAAIDAKCAAIDARLKMLEDRVSVMEEQTISHESRLQEIEEADEDDSTA